MTFVTTEEDGYLIIGTGEDHKFSALSDDVKNATIIIPSSIGDKNIEVISQYAFFSYYTVETVILNFPIRVLEQGVFQNCRNLRRIYIPSSLKIIGNNCFDDCFALNDVVFEQNSKLESIGKLAFNTCRTLSKIFIPSSLKTLGYNAFSEIDVKITILYNKSFSYII